MRIAAKLLLGFVGLLFGAAVGNAVNVVFFGGDREVVSGNVISLDALWHNVGNVLTMVFVAIVGATIGWQIGDVVGNGKRKRSGSPWSE